MVRDEKKTQGRSNEKYNDATTSAPNNFKGVFVLIVHVILDNGVYDAVDPPTTGLSNDVFSNCVDPNNLKSQYAAYSANQLQFKMSPNRIMIFNSNNDSTTNIVNGGIKVEAPCVVMWLPLTTKNNSVYGYGVGCG